MAKASLLALGRFLAERPEVVEELHRGTGGEAVAAALVEFFSPLSPEEKARIGEEISRQVRTVQRRGRHEKLKQFFEGLPARQVQVALSFAEISEKHSTELPPTARKDRTWWANTPSSQGSSWMKAGWRVDAVYLDAQIVVFRRESARPVEAIPQYVRFLLEGSDQPIVHPATPALLEWVRLCRIVGWYYEATVLYERANWTGRGLSESDTVTLEEDYAICKRELTRFKRIQDTAAASPE